MKIIISCSPTLQLIPRNQSGSINTKSDKCLIWVEVNKPLFLCPGSSVRTSRLLVSAQLKETFLLSQLWKEDISKENTFCNHIGIHWQWVRWHIVKKQQQINVLKLTSLFYFPERACPVAAGSGSRAPVGFLLVGQQASLSSHSAPSLPQLHSPSPASLFAQDCEMQNNGLLSKEPTCLVSVKTDSETCKYFFLPEQDQNCGYVHLRHM